jgi:hypothetical protein
MEIRFNVTGTRRKEMVSIISEIIGMKAVYKGMPTCAYAINNLLVSKDGTLITDERTDPDALRKVLNSLERAGFAAESLPINVTDDRVSFPWFSGTFDSDTTQAYINFIVSLCAMAKEAKRVTATEKLTDNEKYAFRCFLLRLGFIGSEYKTYRKILLKNLTGNSAFKSGTKKATEEVGDDAIPE